MDAMRDTGKYGRSFVRMVHLQGADESDLGENRTFIYRWQMSPISDLGDYSASL
jgi:hypothetical protein